MLSLLLIDLVEHANNSNLMVQSIYTFADSQFALITNNILTINYT